MGARILTYGLRFWSLLQAYAAALWVIGPFGIGAGGLSRTLLPEWLSQPLSYGLQGLTVGPITGVVLTDRHAYSQISTLSLQLSGNDATRIMPKGASFGDINLDATAQFSMLTTTQGWFWVLIHVLPLLTMAALWWFLARAVKQNTDSTVFTPMTARLIVVSGAIIAIGAVIVSVLTHWFYVWVAHTSQIADRIRVPAYNWHTIPWPAVVAGAALLVLGDVWRRGVAIETELGGLV